MLKAVLQPSFNMEVKRLCDDYTHIYAMAASNIRENTGDTVPQSTLKLLIMKMIEEVSDLERRQTQLLHTALCFLSRPTKVT